MFEEIERVRERRRQRMKTILLHSRDAMPPYLDELHDPLTVNYSTKFASFHEDGTIKKPPRSMLGVQIVASLCLVGVTYLLFTSSLGIPVTWREKAKEIFTHELKVEGIAQWYEQKFGQLATVLPVFSPKKSVEAAVATPAVQHWKFTGGWMVSQPFETKTNRMVIQTNATGEIINQELGWVTSVTKNEQAGTTIVMRYTDGREIWYGNLQDSSLALNDFVNQGDVIGTGKKVAGDKREVIIALKENDAFINPLDVIALE